MPITWFLLSLQTLGFVGIRRFPAIPDENFDIFRSFGPLFSHYTYIVNNVQTQNYYSAAATVRNESSAPLIRLSVLRQTWLM